MLLCASPMLWAQSANDGFNVTVDSHVVASAVQADGKILIAGYFQTVNGQARSHLARLFVDGSLDPDFANLDNDVSVTSLAVLGDGSIIVGGEFTHFGACLQCAHLAKLHPDGSVDLTFQPNPDGAVIAIVQQRDGRLLIAGSFTHLGASTHHYIARLSADGIVDDSYPLSGNDPDQPLSSIALQLDGKAIIGGAFDTIGAQAIGRVARLRTDGSVDNTFTSSKPIDGSVYAVAIQADGRVVIGGSFATINNVSRPYLARLSSEGLLDAFNPAPDGFVYSLAIQPDGRLLAGGNFFNIAGQEVSKIARFKVDDSLDGGFRPPYTSSAYITSSVRTIAIEPDGRIVVSGAYTPFDGHYSAVGRLNVDATLDTSFNPGANGTSVSIAVQPDGKVLFGGFFSQIGATERYYLARLKANGAFDPAFAAHPNSTVFSIAVQPAGKILVAGDFTEIDSVPRKHVARLDAAGLVDPDFDPNADNLVYCLAVQPDGKILLGGNFTHIGAVARQHIARIYPDGTPEPGFDPSVNGQVNSINVQADGKMLLSGNFSKIGTTLRYTLARLNADGSLDSAFDPKALGGVYNVTTQPDARILIGGNLTTVGTTTRNRVARLNSGGSLDDAFDPNANGGTFGMGLQADGKIVIGGYFTQLGAPPTLRNRIARLEADGSADPGFDPDVSDIVDDLAIQGDGRTLASGTFSTIGGVERAGIARLSSRQAALQSLDVNGKRVTWRRSGSSPELSLPPDLYLSSDGSAFYFAGSMQRVPGGWQYGNLNQPYGQIYYLRTRGRIGQDGSFGLIEYTRQLLGDDRVFGDSFDVPH